MTMLVEVLYRDELGGNKLQIRSHSQCTSHDLLTSGAKIFLSTAMSLMARVELVHLIYILVSL